MRIVTFHEGSEIELIFIFNKATLTMTTLLIHLILHILEVASSTQN